jgi:small-conductance mechanosensitive channel
MPPAVSQVSRGTRTRLRLLRRLLMVVLFLVVAAIVGFAAQQTLGNMVAGVQLAVSQPIRIGDRVRFDDVEGRVVDITLSYTYLDPGDGSSFVIPNQLLVEGKIHNLSTADTEA